MYCTKMGREPGRFDHMCDVLCGFMRGLGNLIIAHTRHLRVFNSAGNRVALLTVTILHFFNRIGPRLGDGISFTF